MNKRKNLRCPIGKHEPKHSDNNSTIKKMKAKYITIILLAILTSCSHCEKETVQIVAHRGLWKDTDAIENTIESLVNAENSSCHAVEFDVRLTKDNVIVLFHDNKVQGITSSESTIDEVKSIVLENGKTIPTLDEFLDAAKTMSIDLILELKGAPTPEKELQAVKLIKKSVSERNLLERTSFISFSLSACKSFIEHIDGSKVYYLCSSSTPEKILTPQQAKEIGLAGIDYSGKVMREHNEWIQECHELGLKVNVWTINKEEDMLHFIENGVDYITTDYPILALKLIGK